MLSRARILWRSARSIPVLGWVVAGADRAWWARAIRRADVVDLDFVAAQGRRRSAGSAVRAYVRGGFRRGMSLNPLFVEGLVSSQLSDAERVPALYAYAISDVRRVRASIAWDSVAYAEAHPESLQAPGGPLGHAWRAARATGSFRLGAGDTAVDVRWKDVHEAAVAAVRRSRTRTARTRVAPLRPTGTPLVFVCRVAPREDLARALDPATAFAQRTDAAVVVAIDGRGTDAWVSASLLARWLEHVQVTDDADDIADTVAASSAEDAVILVRGPRADVDVDTLATLADEGAAGPIGPVSVALDGTIASAGLVAHNGRRFDLLAGHPLEDAANLPLVFDVEEVSAQTFAIPARRTAASARTRSDLIVRAPVIPRGVLDKKDGRSGAEALLAPIGFEIDGWTGKGPKLSRVPIQDSSSAAPRLRWAIKIAAPPGRLGESWGDTHFARGLADALRRLGQEVVIDAYDARRRPTMDLDDVILALRGPEPLEPQRGAFSILWIISHPDEMTRRQLRGFDAVFAGSESWAARASHRFRHPITPLLQCTDATRFRPIGRARTDEILFVGTARGIARPSVVEPLNAGVPISVYGPDWRGYIPASAIVATGIPNADLPARYEGAGVVLNDHWPAMKAAGFVSNRLYDVVAAGGRAVSDHVEGIDEIFHGAVRTYRTIPELLALLTGDLDDGFPAEAELARISAEVRERHSFDARARELVETVLRER